MRDFFFQTERKAQNMRLVKKCYGSHKEFATCVDEDETYSP